MIIVTAEPDGYPEEAKDILTTLGDVIELPAGRSTLLRAAAQANVLIVRLANKIDREVFESAPALRIIVSATTGLNHIDLDEAARRGVAVLSLKGEVEFLKTITATAEHTWGLLLALIRNIVPASEAVRAGHWDRDQYLGLQLSGRTLGIVGYGRLGHIVADYATAFRMKVLYADPFVSDRVLNGPSKVDLPTLLAESDVVCLLAAYSEQNRHMIGKNELALMKRDAVFINSARGELVDQAALLNALRSNQIAGAALDVLDDEAGQTQASLACHPLISFAQTSARLLITPHVGGATRDSMRNAEVFMAQKLQSLIKQQHLLS